MCQTVLVFLVQGLWTDGRLALTVALDQRLHCWQLKYAQITSKQPDGAVNPSSQVLKYGSHRSAHGQQGLSSPADVAVPSGLLTPELSLTVHHDSSSMTQVLEPAALDACSHQDMLLAVIAGRGTQLVELRIA